MRDEEIVALYWQRNEDAIRETEQRYGRYLFKIAYQVLADPEDSEESVNDTYLKAWGSMPPHRPGTLRTYLGKITRQLSIDRLRGRDRVKRRASEYALSLSELEECVSAGDTTQEQVDLRLLAQRKMNLPPNRLHSEISLQNGRRKPNHSLPLCVHGYLLSHQRWSP